MSGYSQGGSDLDSLLEIPQPTWTISALFEGFKLNDGNLYYVSSNSEIDENLTLDFKYGGTAYSFCKKGCFPTVGEFARVTSGSDVRISRSSSGITIGSTTYGPSTFDTNTVPFYIGFVLVGGGGGAGGRGCDKGDKNGWNGRCGGSGGGGGVLSGILNLKIYDSLSIIIGSGGSGGGGGSSDSRPSTGASGGNGNTTYIMYPSSYSTLFGAGGGGGGSPGVGDSGDGNGGESGSGTAAASAPILKMQAVTGSHGNHCQNGGSSAVSLKRYFSNTRNIMGNASFFNNSEGSYYNGSSGQSYKDAYTDGGASFGVGGRSGTRDPGYGGGGGGNGSGNGQAGGGGLAIFYY